MSLSVLQRVLCPPSWRLYTSVHPSVWFVLLYSQHIYYSSSAKLQKVSTKHYQIVCTTTLVWTHWYCNPSKTSFMLFNFYQGDGGIEWFCVKNVELNIKQGGNYRDRNVWLKWGKWRGLSWIESVNYKQGCTATLPNIGWALAIVGSWKMANIIVFQWVLITLFAIWKKQWKGDAVEAITCYSNYIKDD